MSQHTSENKEIDSVRWKLNPNLNFKLNEYKKLVWNTIKNKIKSVFIVNRKLQ